MPAIPPPITITAPVVFDDMIILPAPFLADYFCDPNELAFNLDEYEKELDTDSIFLR